MQRGPAWLLSLLRSSECSVARRNRRWRGRPAAEALQSSTARRRGAGLFGRAGLAKGPWALVERLEQMLAAAPDPADPAAALNFGQLQL